MSGNKLKIGIWSFLVLALVIFVAARLIINTRLYVTESTLTATAESAAQTWYDHDVLHMDKFAGLAALGAQDSVEIISRHGTIEFGNVFYYRIYDKLGRLVLLSSRGALAAKHPHPNPPLPPTTTAEDAAQIRAVLSDGKVVTQITDGWKQSDHDLYVSRSVLPIKSNGEIIGAAEVFVDISASRATIYRAFRQFSETLVVILTLASLIPIGAIAYAWYRMSVLNKDLALARDAARQAEDVKSQFLANMSHEIRTPLNGIMGMSELLNETEMTDEQRSYSATILNSSSALLTIINDILDFSKIEAGKVKIEPQPFDLHNCVQDAADLLFPAGNGKGVELCVDFQKPLPAWVVGDEARLRQCLLNVAGNAVKFTESGHVTIRVSEQEGDRVEIAVSDTGIGIPQDQIETIFRDFEQVDGGDTRSHSGTGLGLAITRRLLRLMGGDVSAESTPGQGSVFRMILPLPATAPPEHVQVDTPVFFLDPSALAGKTAVVVDDLEINRRILTARLASFGMQSLAYDSAIAVLAALKTGRQPVPDILISDHHMPGMDGAELLLALRARPHTAELPIVVLSSGDLEGLRPALTRADIEKCLSKPVRTDLLFKTLCSAMGLSGIAPTAEHTSPPPSTQTLPDIIALRVCLAEDNKTNQFIVQKMIGNRVARFTTWDNGQEAVDNYLSERPDLILMDFSMPVMGGLTATKEIRALERRAGLSPCVIVALTAHAMAEDRDRGDAAGMDGFLSKPIHKAELISTLDAALDRRAAPAKQRPRDARSAE
ncbi:response regulator [Antarcticimicrobium sediminis]|uniref:Sensory/regulatory protein RpfC n=1 Tax=Antarcticimicrobium sediminis TaxID=2546227 RepID=A0A4R5F1M4_9RHOB|nr:response regulator [Antarcticimicrobium sediminis]TDE41192.1 response regulator [Antarcticimicrobium sediminis]